MSPDKDLDVVEGRIAKGIAWLTEHDPTGGNYFRYRDGKLRHYSPMPGLSPQELEDWQRWARNMDTYEQLMKQLERLEARRGQASQ